MDRMVVSIMTLLLYSFFFFFSSRRRHTRCSRDWSSDVCSSDLLHGRPQRGRCSSPAQPGAGFPQVARSEEHTSELQSRLHLVCRLLLEKKKKDAPTLASRHPPRP